MYSKIELDARIRFIMSEITNAAKRGTNLVPTDEDMVYIDSLAAELFRLSGGTNEVLYDKLGRPSIYVNFYADETARISYLSNGGAILDSDDKIHPAFIVKNKAIRGFRIQKFSWVRYNDVNYPVSLYGMDPARNITLTASLQLVDTANAGSVVSDGETIHLMTLAEWAYIALRGVREGFQPRGNDSHGKSSQKSDETGSPASYLESGVPKQILTGTGKTSWYSDGSIFGVSDLRGNVTEWTNGCRLNNGKIYIYPDNDAASPDYTAADFSVTSDNYKSIMPDGSLVTKGAEGCIGYDYSSSQGNGQPGKIVTSLTPQSGDSAGYISQPMRTITTEAELTIPAILRYLTLGPEKSAALLGNLYARTNGERGLHCGGYWSSGANAGLGYRIFNDSPAYSYATIGARAASIIL